ncbi:hypothetical protein [Micavibrio aeruginosavorus]|uniref:hypothetical protein n=1 Tax=Micavibrio aeruginosavorus TaxID=349221 RepID=UPI003F4A8CF0
MVADSCPPPRPTSRTAFADGATPVSTDEKIIPTWSDDNIIVTLPATTQEERKELERAIFHTKLSARATPFLYAVPLLPLSMSGYGFYHNITTPAAEFQKQADTINAAVAQKKRLMPAYDIARAQDANVANTTPFILDARSTEIGAACWAQYTTNTADNGTINTQMLGSCIGTKIQDIPDNPVQADPDYLIFSGLFMISLVFFGWIAAIHRDEKKELACLTAQRDAQTPTAPRLD